MTKNFASLQRGFTLVELMITIAIMGVLASIALPIYSSYTDTAEEGVLRGNINTIVIFQEDFFLRNGFYSEPHANLAAITLATGWAPRTEGDVTYVVGNTDGTELYQVTATHPDGLVVCIQFPDKINCP